MPPVVCVTLFGFISLLPSAAVGTTYYIDSVRGNDAANGSHIWSVAGTGPWRTFRRLAAISLKAGDVVDLDCGDVWHSPLTISGSGHRRAPIIVGHYGQCSKEEAPTIDLAQQVGGWVASGGGLYVAKLGFRAYNVYVNGRHLARARFPASGWRIASGGVPSALPNEGSSDALDSTLSLLGINLSHTVMHVRTVGWHIEEVPVVGYLHGEILLAKSTKYPIRRGAGYYLTGARWMLNRAPGWYQDQTTGRLYIRLPDGGSPQDETVEASRYEVGLSLINQSNIVISGLRIEHAGADGVEVRSSKHIILKQIQIEFSAHDGVAFTDHSTGSIRDSKIQNSAHDGIFLDHVDGIRVFGDSVLNTGIVGSPKNSLAAIDATHSNGDLIENNLVDHAGYIGIRFNRYTQVVDNVVRNTCMALDDCGAIYSWDYVDPQPLRSRVVDNIVQNVMGNRIGNPDPFTLAAGIYLDDRSNGVEVDGNTISNAERGIYLHNAFNNVVRRNIIFDCRAYGIVLGMNNSRKVKGGNAQNIVRGNTVVSREEAPFLFYLDSSDSLFNDDIVNNKYVGTTFPQRVVIQWNGGANSPAAASELAHLRSEYDADIRHGTVVIGSIAPSLLLNDTAIERRLKCPAQSAMMCASAESSRGTQLTWPISLPPFRSLVVVWH